jgi:hypothetical protein
MDLSIPWKLAIEILVEPFLYGEDDRPEPKFGQILAEPRQA